jgi:4-amino-4-deoxy-L-arabinose transferase-like glycosyltransferase
MCKHLASPSATDASAHQVLLLIFIAGLLHLALAGSIGLSVDESYTVSISRRFALSYFDHPPLHIWLAGAWARLLGSERPLLMRFPFVVLFAGSTWLMYRLTASAYGDRAGLWAALALNLMPLFTVNTAIGILPDGPLVFFCLLGVLCFARAVLTPKPEGSYTLWMLAAGIAVAFALLSKYMAVFTLCSLGLYLLTRRRSLLVTPAPRLALLLVLFAFTPVLMWNHEHDWVSFAFQARRGLPSGFSLGRAALDLGGQLLYLLPWIAWGLLVAITDALRRVRADEASWLLAYLSVPPIAAFSLAGLWTKVLPHWPAIGWLFALPLLGRLLALLERDRTRLIRRMATATAGFLLCGVSLFASQAAAGWVERFAPGFAAHDPTLDFLTWRALEATVAGLRQRHPDVIVATVSWIDAGKADYALGGVVPVICVSSDPRGFAFMRDWGSVSGRDALIIAADGRPDWLQLAKSHFQRIELLADIPLSRSGQPALTLHAAYGYHLQRDAAR